MKLAKIQVRNFRSIDDSEVFEIGDLTCLVGKNEAGKTAILRAIHGIRPIDKFTYDKTRDYPRRYLSKFDERHADGESLVAKAWWTLDAGDVSDVEAVLGSGVFAGGEVVVMSYIGRNENKWVVPIDAKVCLQNAAARHGIVGDDFSVLQTAASTEAALDVLLKLNERTVSQEGLLKDIQKFRDGSAALAALDILSKRMPKFFYTSHFERMSGEISLTGC